MRITKEILQKQVDTLNKITGKTGHWSEIDAYAWRGADGGVALYQYVNEHGGIRDVFNAGHMPKKELSGRINAYIKGITEGKRLALENTE